MCLALPVCIIQKLDDSRAIVDLGGISKEVSIVLLDDVLEGDFVIIHAGYALSKLDEVEAEKTLGLFAELEGQAI